MENIKLEQRRYLRRNLTPEEAVLWSVLKSKQIFESKWRKQHLVGNYILDFYCPKAKLCIELDGKMHYTFQGAKEDEQRTKYLNSKGIRVIRFENRLIWENFEEIINIIKQEVTSTSNANLEF